MMLDVVKGTEIGGGRRKEMYQYILEWGRLCRFVLCNSSEALKRTSGPFEIRYIQTESDGRLEVQ